MQQPQGHDCIPKEFANIDKICNGRCKWTWPRIHWLQHQTRRHTKLKSANQDLHLWLEDWSLLLQSVLTTMTLANSLKQKKKGFTIKLEWSQLRKRLYQGLSSPLSLKQSKEPLLFNFTIANGYNACKYILVRSSSPSTPSIWHPIACVTLRLDLIQHKIWYKRLMQK